MASLDLIIKSTIQAVVLSGFSNILAQLLTAYQTNVRPYYSDPQAHTTSLHSPSRSPALTFKPVH